MCLHELVLPQQEKLEGARGRRASELNVNPKQNTEEERHERLASDSTFCLSLLILVLPTVSGMNVQAILFVYTGYVSKAMFFAAM